MQEWVRDHHGRLRHVVETDLQSQGSQEDAVGRGEELVSFGVEGGPTGSNLT